MAGYKQTLKVFMLGILLLSAVLIFGCTQKEQAVIKSDEEEGHLVTGSAITEEKQNRKNQIQSPLNGMYIDKEKLNSRVIAVMLDNQYSARPQAALSKCDVVYEILAEGNITRYMGIIGSEQPDNMGPVRSSRDYFIEKALEYDALYVHVGGSPQAYKAIQKLNVASVDAMNQISDIFWRKKHKFAPHNTYTNYDAILKGANRKKFRDKGEFEPLLFYEDDMEIEGEIVTLIRFPYNGIKYYSSYEYDEDEKVYNRYINGEPHLDENEDISIKAKNIIVQFAETKLIKGDPEGRLTIRFIGEGEGLYITNGKYKKITWEKTDERSMTRYYDEKGNEILLNPGKIWIQIYPEHRAGEIEIEG